MLQNATPLRKSAPRLPNISDEHVSCTAPATRNTSFQMLFKCPLLAIVFGNGTKTLTFCLLLTMYRIHRACHAKPHLNLQKWSERVVLFAFWLGNVLRATARALFRHVKTSNSGPSMVCFVHLTWTCASSHNGVHFFDMSTSKSGPSLVCFAPFDFEMCFAPQRRAIFNLPSGQGSAPAALASLFFDRGATNHWKKQWIATFLPFHAPASSFFWLFLFSDLLSSFLLFSYSSHLCFAICPYCRKFHF